MVKHESEYKIYHYTTVGNYKVLAVAVINKNAKDIAVYIGGVKGLNHDNEFMDIVRHGGKVYKRVATAIFPLLMQQYAWRE